MDVVELAEHGQDAATVKRVFGEPIVGDDVTILPVARVSGGGGAGSGKQEGDQPGQGAGGGYGIAAVPAGVFVIKDGKVRWQPAIDVNRVIMGGQVLALALLVTVRSVARLRARSRAARTG